jgi:hypothetical protein
MKHLSMFGFAVLAAALTIGVITGSATATVVEEVPGTPLGVNTNVTAESEGTTELHTSFGSINCNQSHVAGKIIHAGGVVEGTTVGVKVTVENLNWIGCNAQVKPLTVGGDFGTLEILSLKNGKDGTLYGTNQEVTVEYLGFHCIFKTNQTKLGTVTGKGTTGSNATLDIEATIPRTGGRSGAFCGTTGQWTGSYIVTAPNPLYVT